MSYIIMAASQQQHGKDLSCDYLATKLNEITKTQWNRVSLASKVKEIYCNAFGVDLEFIEKWKVINEPPPGLLKTVRKSLQFIGDGFREIDDNIWINKLFRNLPLSDGAICSDGRYFNELKTSQEWGGFNILVVRPDKLNNDENRSEAQIKPLLDWAIDNTKEKPKEMELINYVIMNDGTKEELYAKLDALIPVILEHFKIKVLNVYESSQ